MTEPLALAILAGLFGALFLLFLVKGIMEASAQADRDDERAARELWDSDARQRVSRWN